MRAKMRKNARADRAWAGLRARLNFGQTPRRDGRRTRDEKRSTSDWLPENANQRARKVNVCRNTSGKKQPGWNRKELEKPESHFNWNQRRHRLAIRSASGLAAPGLHRGH